MPEELQVKLSHDRERLGEDRESLPAFDVEITYSVALGSFPGYEKIRRGMKVLSRELYQ
jgi:hypothetical protein